MKQIYKNCIIECFREGDTLYCSIFAYNGYEINTFYTNDTTNVRGYIKYLKEMIDEWYEGGCKEE